jgi:hypothetical protein
MRIAVARRYPKCRAGVRVLCLWLVMLGLIDSVALVPLALAGAVLPDAGTGVRIGLAVVAAAGVGAALAATRVGASEALHVAVSIGVLGVLTGTGVLVAAIVWRSGTLLLPRTSD